MERAKKVKIITEQVINMYDNNVLHDGGCEGFIGWLEGGDVFFHAGYNTEEIAELMELADQVAPIVDKLSYEHLHSEEFSFD